MNVLSGLPAMLADASVRSLIPATAGLIAVLIMGRGRASFRHAVWTAVLSAMLLMPVLTLCLPAIPLRVLPGRAMGPILPQTALQTAAGPTGALATAGPAQAAPVDWRSVAAWGYLAIAAALMARLAAGYVSALRLARGAKDTGLQREYAAILESGSARVPLTIGWLRPVILLPAGWRTWESGKLRAALEHELAHIARRDWLIGLWAALNRCIFWFHPLAWFLERRLGRLAEEACDDACLLALDDRDTYARTLVEVAEALGSGGRRVEWGTTAMAHASGLRRRVDRILDTARNGAPGIGTKTWLALALISIPLAIGAAATNLHQATAPSAMQPAEYYRYLSLTGPGGEVMTAEQVAPAEAKLRDDPEDLTLRARLMSFYIQHGQREAYAGHAIWFIENHPEAEHFAPWFTALSAKGSPEYDAAFTSRARQLWIRQVDLHGSDARVLANASSALATADFGLAVEFAQRARALEPSSDIRKRRVQNYYVTAAVAAYDGDEFLPAVVPPDAASRLKAELEASTEPELLGTVGSQLVMQALSWKEMRERAAQRDGTVYVATGRAYKASEIPERPGLAQAGEFGKSLLHRAQQLEPGNSRWRNMLDNMTLGLLVGSAQPQAPAPEMPPPAPGVNRVRVGGTVQAAKIIESVRPEYPALAKQARIQGIVRFVIVVGANGEVAHAQLISGHPLLAPAALEAIKKWRYQTTLLNGVPAEVLTQVDVNFTLSEGPGPGLAANPLSGDELRRRTVYADQRFGFGTTPGSESPRGRTYLRWGPPDEIESHPSGTTPDTPWEVWLYRSFPFPGAGGEMRIEFLDWNRTGEYRQGSMVLKPHETPALR